MNETIEALRTRIADAPVPHRLTAAEVRGIVDGLSACKSLSEVSAETGLSESQVLDVVAEFGTWLTHVHGGSGAVTVDAVSADQQELFQPTRASVRPAKAAKPKAKVAKPVKGSAPVVTIPLGFERTASHRRDVSKALASIVVTDPDDENITRFLARQQPSQAKVLTFAHVTTVWSFARLGRLAEIGEINAANPVLCEMLVAAFDVLDVARTECVKSVELLASADVSDVQALADAAARCRWVAEGEISKLERVIDLALANPSSVRLLEKELRFFAQSVAACPSRYQVTDIASLTDAHVRRIAQSAGLVVDATSRSLEAEIRGRLQEMGLGADVDRLVPDGVRAETAGLSADFWSAMERRVDGDPDWDEDLREAFSSYAVTAQS